MRAAPSEICAQRNILIVDDLPENLRLLSEILGSADYQVRPASSGRLALDAVQTILPDLILLDIMMPGLDGYQVCRELKEDSATRDIPVIFVSAANEIDERLQAFELGGVDFIAKPFQPEEVLARVHLHLQLRDSQLLLQHEVKAHEKAREELKRHQQGLEELVTHRTRELEAINKKLRQEIDLHKSTEQALYESEQRYRGLINIGFNGILIEKEQRVVYANQRLCEILRTSEQDLTGQSVFELLPSPAQETLKQYIQADQEEIIEHDLQGADGGLIRVESIGFKSSYQGEPARIVAIRDISDKQRLREEAERASRLASLGELAAGVAHEINNPNAVIQLNISVIEKVLNEVWPLVKKAAAQDPDLKLAGLSCDEVLEQLPQMLTRVRKSSGRIKQIVDDLKNFVRKQNDLPHKIIDLNQVVETACRLMDNTLREATDQFNFQPLLLAPLLKGDFQRLEQVVINLVQNACHALTDREQEVLVRTYQDERGRSCLQVRDQGGGIASEDLPKITNPFFTTRRNVGGTGLGLSVSARILQEHAATLDVVSTPGQGASFTICFPLVEEKDNL